MAKDVQDSDDRLDGSTGHLSDRLERGRPADVAADRGPFAKRAEQHPGYPALLFVEGQEGGVGLA